MKQQSIIRNRKESIIKNMDFNYDELNDILYAYKDNSNVFSNVIIGEFHLEFNKDGKIVGIEILKASDVLKEYDIGEDILKNIDDIELKVITNNNSLLVFLTIHAFNKEKSATITMNNIESPIGEAIAAV